MTKTKLLLLAALLSLAFVLASCSGGDASDKAAAGAKLVEEGRWEDAIVELDLAIDQYTTNIGFLKTTGRHAPAEEIEIDLAETYVDRSTAHLELGQVQLAMTDLDNAIRLRKDYAPAFANRALAHTRLGNDAEAEEDVNAAAALNFDVTKLRQDVERLKQAR